jgi:indole-3-glycerol phosphate synthase
LTDFLTSMEASSRQRFQRAVEILSLSAMRSRALGTPVPGLAQHSFYLFAEVKPVSPADGVLSSDDPLVRAQRFGEGGAAAVSVLTEPSRFGGSLGLLQAVALTSSAPVMRKDFLVDPYQIWESRSFGASGVLLIARLFDRDGLMAMIETAHEAGLFAVVEAFDESDLSLVEAAVEADPTVFVGVNSRDLATLKIRPDTHRRLVKMLPEDATLIAESGLTSTSQVVELREMGYDGVLIGSSLMRSDDPAGLISEMLAGVAE